MSEEAELTERLRTLNEEITRLEVERSRSEEMHREQLHVLRGEANHIALRLQYLRMKQ